MATLEKEIKDILSKYGIDPQDKTKLWDCHGTLVLYHKAYEVIAAQENIKFDPPKIIEANAKEKTAVLCVTGYMGERSEWSFGEATSYNSKNSYPFAMAEKRAKDRVIGKLVGLAQYVYSEDEADDFKEKKPKENNQRSLTPVDKTGDKKLNDWWKDKLARLRDYPKDEKALLETLNVGWDKIQYSDEYEKLTEEQQGVLCDQYDSSYMQIQSKQLNGGANA